jgi:hypothetical protein
MNSNTPQIINTEKIYEVDFIQGRKGLYRAVIKVQAGFMVVVDDIGIENNWGRQDWNKAIDVFRNFKKGALQTIQFKAEGSTHWTTVFAKKGTKIVLMDTQLFLDMEVGDINQNWTNTNLYSQKNYQAAGAKTWADKAFVLNHPNAA